MQTRSKTYANRGSRRVVKMNPGLWRKLPNELLEHVLSFLPGVALYKFRAVCKRWDNLVCSPVFGKLCMLNATSRGNEQACFVVNYRFEDMSFTQMSRWSILDLKEKQWYNLKPDLPRTTCVMDMDRGFVCTFFESFTQEQVLAPNIVYDHVSKMQTLVVFNLFGGAMKVLRNPPWGEALLEDWTVKLVVENTSNNFKILLRIADFLPGSYPMYLYESSTDQWRMLQNPQTPPPSLTDFGVLIEDPRSVIFQGLLYVLFRTTSSISVLCRLNLLDGSWEDTGMQLLHRHHSACAELVALDTRLFLLNIVKGDLPGRMLEISEISVADKMIRTMVRTKLSVVSPFGPLQMKLGRIQAFGFNKSILLMCGNTGQVVMYNLVTGEWECLPQNPQDGTFPGMCRSFSGGRMKDFRLPSLPW